MAICQARIEEAENQVESEGMISDYVNTKRERNSVANPAVGVSMKYAQLFKCLCIEFGMTPSSRGRLEVPNEDGKDDFASKLRSKIG